MNRFFDRESNGYTETIRKGVQAVRGCCDGLSFGAGSREERLKRLSEEVDSAGAIVIGAGAGLSTAAGLTYSGERFERYFFDFAGEFGIRDIYSGGFYPFPDDETRWAWWARHIYYNRYVDAPKPVYAMLLDLVRDKNYFVITTNVDHQFQRAGFDKTRLFYTQGDYGLFQRADGRGGRTWDNEDWVLRAMEAQGFEQDENGMFQPPAGKALSMRLPRDMVPADSESGLAVAMNLRSDDSFVEDAGWRRASASYVAFLREHEKEHVLFWEMGVGANTPVIIKYPFWAMTEENPKAVYACMNRSEAVCPLPIEARSICLNGDIGGNLEDLALIGSAT